MYYKDPRFKKHEDHDIWICNNFIPDSYCDEIVKKVELFDDSVWVDGWARHQLNILYSMEYDEYGKAYSQWWESKVSPPVLTKAINKINIELKKIFFDEYLFMPEYNVKRILQNEFMPAHRDGLAKETKKGAVSGFILYLNDFDGGEINYPEIKYTYSPKKGDIVIHNGTILHEVLPLKSKKRYTISSWLFDK